MATLQKFKLLATQCAVSGSPARSPTTSPVVHLRRRKTLRMLLNLSSATPERRRFSRREDDRGSSVSVKSPERKGNKKEVKSRRKLKELFVSSPPPLDERESDGRGDDGAALRPMTRRGGDGLAARRGGADRGITSTFRYRLLMRRAWRPILVAIPE